MFGLFFLRLKRQELHNNNSILQKMLVYVANLDFTLIDTTDNDSV